MKRGEPRVQRGRGRQRSIPSLIHSLLAPRKQNEFPRRLHRTFCCLVDLGVGAQVRCDRHKRPHKLVSGATRSKRCRSRKASHIVGAEIGYGVYCSSAGRHHNGGFAHAAGACHRWQPACRHAAQARAVRRGGEMEETILRAQQQQVLVLYWQCKTDR